MPDSSKKPILNDLTIEVTNQCHSLCRHCEIWTEKERYEISAALFARLLKELLGRYRFIKFISITGGDPFLHKKCGDLLKSLTFYRKRKKINTFGIYSNGTYFQGVQSVLSEHGKDLNGMKVGISIDGNQETHNYLRGAGAYQKAMKTLQWIAENFGKEITLELKFTTNSINYAELEDVYQLARRFKAQFSPKVMETEVSDYYHRAGISNINQLASLTPIMVKKICQQITKIIKDGYSGVDKELVGAMMLLLSHGKNCIRACTTPGQSLFITSRRDVYPCLYLRPIGKISPEGRLPKNLDTIKKEHTDTAAKGNCPRCLAYHGFLKNFNLKYLQQPPVPQRLPH